MKIQQPEPGMVIEITVGILDGEPTKVIGIVAYAKMKRRSKYFERGLYVRFKKVMWVEPAEYNDISAIYENRLPFFVLRGEWREVPKDEAMGKVL